jgi:prophage antirepressor-like protein/phage antirepressor YoqD-like protein
MTALAVTLTFDGHRVRMVGTPERPEWVARDVCRVLQIHSTANALQNAGVTAAEKGVDRIHTPGGPQDVTTVTEPGLWKLVLISRKPAAQRFKAWLATEVIPSIRRHGCFPPPPERPALPSVDLDDPAALRGLVEVFAVRRLADMEKIAELTPKAEAHDRLSLARGDVNLQEAGRALGWGPNLFIWRLLDDGLLFRAAGGRPEPHAEHLKAGRFRVVVTERDGQAWPQTVVTPAGLQWLAGRYPYQPQAPLSLPIQGE